MTVDLQYLTPSGPSPLIPRPLTSKQLSLLLNCFIPRSALAALAVTLARLRSPLPRSFHPSSSTDAFSSSSSNPRSPKPPSPFTPNPSIYHFRYKFACRVMRIHQRRGNFSLKVYRLKILLLGFAYMNPFKVCMAILRENCNHPAWQGLVVITLINLFYCILPIQTSI